MTTSLLGEAAVASHTLAHVDDEPRERCSVTEARKPWTTTKTSVAAAAAAAAETGASWVVVPSVVRYNSAAVAQLDIAAVVEG